MRKSKINSDNSILRRIYLWLSVILVYVGYVQGQNVQLDVDGSAQFTKIGPELGRLILKTQSQNDPGRYGILFSNNDLAPFLGDDQADQVFGFYSEWDHTRTYDAAIRVHGKATNNWLNYIELTHNGTNGHLKTDNGDLILSPDQGNGSVGIGTNDPEQKLDIRGSLYIHDPGQNPAILLAPSSLGPGNSPEFVIQSAAAQSGFNAPFHISRNAIFNNSDDQYHPIVQAGEASKIEFGSNGDIMFSSADVNSPILSFGNNMIIKKSGNVGIGNLNPTQKLHIQTAADPQIRLQDAGGHVDVYGGADFLVRNSSSVNMMVLNSNGNLTIAGSLMEGSDRNRKENIVKVDPHKILERIIHIPVSTWNYRGDPVTHMGPMAQDFYAAFGLGPDDKSLAGIDVQGALLASVQALKAENEVLKAKVENLIKRLEVLE